MVNRSNKSLMNGSCVCVHMKSEREIKRVHGKKTKRKTTIYSIVELRILRSSKSNQVKTETELK